MYFGLASVLFSAVALLLMHVTQVVPFRWSSTHRVEEPEVFRRFQIVYLAIGMAGAVIALVGSLRS